MFCPMQYQCGQSTFLVDKPAVNTEVSMNYLPDVVFGGGPFVNGPYEDDEDAILW